VETSAAGRVAMHRFCRISGVTLIGLIAPLLCAGCTRAPTPASAPAPTPSISPRATLTQLIELHVAQKYHDLPPLVVSGRGDDVVKFLMAVDDFLAANRRLCDWLREHVGLGLSQIIDQSYVVDDLAIYAGDDLGVFSRHVELLDSAVEPDQATVAFTIAERLPARHARLRKIDGGWRYDPGPRFSDDLPTAFHELARGLESVLADLEYGRLSADALSGSPELLLEKVKARLRRGVNLLSKAQAASESGRPE
jgi:hypothetical protein